MKLSTATVLSALALSQRPGGVASQGIKASFPLLLFGKVAAINFVEEQPEPLFQLHDADADAAAADLDQDQGIDIDDLSHTIKSASATPPLPNSTFTDIIISSFLL